jgi:enoyl-CoA hydratase/carnithine racemase
VSGQEAKDMGLVDAVFGTPDSLRRAVEDMAIEIASRAPLGIRAAKQLLDGTQHMPLSDALESSKGPRIALNFTRDFKEGVTAFAEKRSPCFLGE